MNLIEFSDIFQKDIYPYYKKHQDTFDPDGIHGTLHISRAVIAGYILAKKYGANTDQVLYATAFHDSGRTANGVDFFESQSASNCKEYLTSNNLPDAITTSNLIVKSINKNTIEFYCTYDADVLEIMRPCCGHGGIGDFVKDFIMTLNKHSADKDYFDKLIREWWEFISETEAIKSSISKGDCIKQLISIVGNNPKYPLINAGIIN